MESVHVKNRRTKGVDFKKVALVILCFSLSIFLIAPLIYLASCAFMDANGNFIGFENFKEYLKSPALIKSFFNTVIVSVLSTIIATVLAFMFAYGIRRANIKFKWLLRIIAMLPLFAPTMMHAIGLVYLFGNKGIITNLGIDIGLYGIKGIILPQIIYIFPQIFLILDVALSTTDYRLYEASAAMGVSKVKEFIYITIPSIKYALISAFFVSFTLCFTDFGSAKIVGGSFNVLAIDIYKKIVGQQNMSMGATVGIVLLIPAIISFLVTQKVQKKQNSYISSKSTDYIIKKNTTRDKFFSGVCFFIAICILSVMIAVIVASIIKLWPYDLTLSLEHYSMKNTLDGLKPFINSIIIATLTAIIGTIFVFACAYLTENIKGAKFIKAFSYFLSILPMALPGLVLGISYVLFFNTPEFSLNGKLYILNYFNVFYGTAFLMIFCNIVHFYSVTFITAITAIKKIDKEINMVSKSLGIRGFKSMIKITLPLCISAVLENFMYFFVNSMVTVSALIFIYTAQFKVGAISIVQLDDKGNIAKAAALSVMILLTNILVKITYELIKKVLVKKGKLSF